MHTNAALKVCVRANNTDAVWSVASRIPDRGPNAANALTFTTILNFLQQSALINGPEDETEEQSMFRRERLIVDGKRIWVDVAGKWSASQLKIDEELVCAMGRLLLVGSRPRDWDDVLSLVAQTMNIPRLLPRLGTVTQDGHSGVPLPRFPLKEPQVEADHDPEAGMSGAEFLPLNEKGIGSARLTPFVYAKPGNNTLSLIQEVCLALRANKESTAYWNLLTDPNTYGLKPDLNNLHMRLRVLRSNRASRDAAELIEHDLVGAGHRPTRGTYRIAMSSCGRDSKNLNVLHNAGRILESMTSNLVDADSKTTTMYADLVDKTARGASDIKDALIKLEPALSSIKIQLGVGKEIEETRGAATWSLSAQERVDAMEAIKTSLRLYSRMMASKELTNQEARPYVDGNRRLSSLLNRLGLQTRRRADVARQSIHNRDNERPESSQVDDDDDDEEEQEMVTTRHKKSRHRDSGTRRTTVEVFDAWEKLSNEERDRTKSREGVEKVSTEPEESEEQMRWKMPREPKVRPYMSRPVWDSPAPLARYNKPMDGQRENPG